MLPKLVTLESCTVCKLKCRGCCLHRGVEAGVGVGYLTFENFAKFLGMNPFIEGVDLTNVGEVFYNPDLLEILEYAYSRGITIDLWDTSFHDVHEEILKALVRCNVCHIKISISGATPESYAWYCRGGDFEKVIANVKKVNQYKEKYENSYPQLFWQYIILEKTDSKREIQKAKKLAKELGFTKITFIKDNDGYVPKNKKMIYEETGLKYD